MKLYLVRHGDNFDKGDVILRCGRRTDLPLSATGIARAKNLGAHFRTQNITPNRVFASPLLRTQQTAHLALPPKTSLVISEALNEIDHGPDEGQPEENVIARVGAEVLERWNKHLIMPPEWCPSPETIAAATETLLNDIAKTTAPDDTIMAFTSNGIARFFTQHAAWDIPRPDDLKLSVCGYTIMEHRNQKWHVTAWNQRAPHA
jgi:broad specificity phosphatase PhoE